MTDDLEDVEDPEDLLDDDDWDEDEDCETDLDDDFWTTLDEDCVTEDDDLREDEDDDWVNPVICWFCCSSFICCWFSALKGGKIVVIQSIKDMAYGERDFPVIKITLVWLTDDSMNG